MYDTENALAVRLQSSQAWGPLLEPELSLAPDAFCK